MRRFCCLAAVVTGLSVAAGTAQAAVVAYTGALTAGSPTFYGPFDSPGDGPPTQLKPDLHPYQVIPIAPAASAHYVFAVVLEQIDANLTLYRDSFDPASPLANALDFDDDSNGNIPLKDYRPLLAHYLIGGTQYYIVVSNYAPEQLGFYKMEVSSTAPEPATWALMLMGSGAAGAAMRRRRRNPHTV